MRRRIRAIGALFLVCAVTLALAQTGDTLFGQARAAELAGDLPGATTLYERIVRDFPSNRPLVARALVQLGEVHEKLKDDTKAREYFERVVRDYKDQTDSSSRAQARLAVGEPTRIEIRTPYTDDPFAFAISPDGKTLVYQATVNGKDQLWLYSFDTAKATPIPGTENSTEFLLGGEDGGRHPFWSPDGRSIGFFADRKLKRIDIGGGAPQILAEAPSPRGAAWSSAGVIVFAPTFLGPLYRVPETGGEPVAVTRIPRAFTSDRFPHILADGRHFLFYRAGAGGALLGSLDNMEPRRLTNRTGAAAFVPPNRLMVVGDAGVQIWEMDIPNLQLAGSPVQFLDRIATTFDHHALSASASGPVAFRVERSIARQFVWRDRQGRQTGSVGKPLRELQKGFRLSPDGRTVAFEYEGNNPSGGFGSDVGLLDLEGGALRTWVLDAFVSWPGPVWAPRGDQIAYSEFRGSAATLWSVYRRPLTGGTPQLLLRELNINTPNDWSPDDRFLMFARLNTTGGARDLLALPLQDKGDPVPIAATAADEAHGRFSPDGKWIAYQSDEVGGRYQIFVQPFPGSTTLRRRISIDGGTLPEWRRDGKELYFLSADNHLMAAVVSLPANDLAIEFGKPAPVFPSPLADGSTYAPSADGARFLINAPAEEAPPILVLSDWKRATR